MRHIWIIFLLLFLGRMYETQASDSLLIEGPVFHQDLLPYASLFEDSSGKMTIEDMLQSSPPFQSTFAYEQESQFPEAFWLHIPIKTSVELRDGLLVIPGDSLRDEAWLRLDFLASFLIDETGQLIQQEKSGYFTPRSEKKIQEHSLIVALPISLEANKRYGLYIRFQNIHTPQTQFLHIELRDKAVGVPSLNLKDRWVILGPLGMFIIIGILTLVFFFYLKDRAFLFFGIFCFLYAFDLLSIEPSGGATYLFTEHPTLGRQFFQFSLFSISFMLLFGNTFIDVKRHFPKWHTYYLVTLSLISVVVAAYFIRSFWQPYIMHPTGLFLFLLLIIPVGIRFIWSTNWTARIFAIGFFSFLGGNVISVFAMINGYSWAAFASFIGLFGILFIFTIGLGYRFLQGERKQAQAEKIKELDQLKTRFFTNISHEFRTPLSLILGPLQNAEEGIPATEMENNQNEIDVRVGHIRVMKRNALRLQQLINQILDLSKIDSGKMQLKLQKGPILAFIRARVSEFSDIAQRKRIHLITNYLSENPHAVFDQDKLEKIFVNIISNAIKYTPENGEIHLSAQANEQLLSVTVEDTGPGMTQAETDQIFDRFFQSAQTNHQGSGIGMALVKELVDLHKGQIHVESLLGKGTKVSFSLQIHPDSFHANDFLPADLAPSSSHHVLLESEFEPLEKEGSTHEDLILIVEDNADLQAYISELLQDNYQLIHAKNGQEGIELAEKHLPDLIVSDVMMPLVSGTALCEYVKKEEKTSHIPVILLTAKAEQKDKWEGLSTGADDYLTKPFDAKELKLKIENLIQVRKHLRQKYSQQPWALSEVASNSMEEKFLQKVTAVITENIGNEYFTVEELGNEIGYSRSQLFRKLKSLLGKSPLELIREQRLHFAKNLLEQRAANVSEAAFQAGYSSTSYFSKSFKKEFGISPSEL